MAKKIGLNMYTLREQCPDNDGLKRTFDRVAESGYRFVQISGLNHLDPADISSAMTSSQLKACATHLGWDQFTGDLDAVIELHRLYGTTHSAIGGLSDDYRNMAGAERFIEELKPVLPRLIDAGLDFSYHNHNHEFTRLKGKTWLDIVHDGGAPLGLKFELDVYWVVAGGADPAEYIASYADEISIIHLKDMIVTNEREQSFSPVGSGNLNWARIFSEINRTDIEFVIVEQDDHYEDDPMGNVAASYTFLSDNGYTRE